jgi:hypothetical protein
MEIKGYKSQPLEFLVYQDGETGDEITKVTPFYLAVDSSVTESSDIKELFTKDNSNATESYPKDVNFKDQKV